MMALGHKGIIKCGVAGLSETGITAHVIMGIIIL